MNQSFSVSYKTFLSEHRFIKSGVPQGSILRPIVFLMFVNYLSAFLDCEVLMFADPYLHRYLKLFRIVNSINYCKDPYYDVDELVEW